MKQSRSWKQKASVSAMIAFGVFVAGHAIGAAVPSVVTPPASAFNPFSPKTPLANPVDTTRVSQVITAAGGWRPLLKDPFRPPNRSPYTP